MESSKMVYASVFSTLILVLLGVSLWIVVQQRASNHNINGTTNSANAAAVQRGDNIAIMGPMYSGKTTLFNSLTVGTVRPCVTSQEVSIWPKFLNSKATLVEFPGHAKLQYKWQNWLSQLTSSSSSSSSTGSHGLKGIIFMVDSTLDPKQWDKPAEMLIEILDHVESLSQPTSVLIACNKCESFTARPPQKIKQILEQEIGQVLSRRKVSLVSGGPHNEESPLLDMFLDPLQFRFDALETTVEALAGSATKNKIDSWQQWLEDQL